MAGTRLVNAERSERGRAWLTLGRTAVVFGSMAAILAAGSLLDPTSAVTRSEQAGFVGDPVGDPVGFGGQTAPKSDRLRPELKTPPRGTPVDVIAERITYDADADVAVATGNVVITYGNYVLEAREVVYDRRGDRLRADGDIRLIEPGGNVLEADVAELWNRFRDGFAAHLRLLLTNDATITAQYATRRDGAITVYTAVTYTRCKTCVSVTGTPLWQIRSAEVTHDENEGVIYHRDASFEILGMTVFWLPYLSHPDPTVSRRSGFLIPTFRYSDLFGLGVEMPYFWNLAPNYDITFRPLLTSRQGPLARAEWRHRLARGVYSVDAGGIYQLDTDVRPPGDRRWRGFARTRGDFNINRHWAWGWDATAFTDETFMRRYRIDGRTEVVSQAHLTGLRGRNYFTAQALHFQGLLPDDRSETFPFVVPFMRHDYTLDRPVLGGEFGFDAHVYSLVRDDPWMPFPTVRQARRQSRAVVDTHWQRRMVGAMGQVVTPFARVRGDVYVTEDLPDASDPDRLRDEQITARLLPTAGVDLRWPFMRSDWLGAHVVTPVAQIISSPSEVNQHRIGNEDAIQVNFDHTGLFLHDRFMGQDRFEGGTRANVGLLYTMLLPSGGFARASFGQSYHIAGDNSFAPGSGLAGTRSDLVGSLALQPFENLRLSYQLRLDEDTFDVHTQEIGLNARLWGLNTTLNYVAVGAEPAQGRAFDQQQVWGAAEYALGGGWSVLGAARYDLETNRVVRSQIGLGFNCDCFNLQVYYRHDNTRDRDIREDHSVLLRVEFRTLGSGTIGGAF